MSEELHEKLLESALEYAGYGWKVIPLRPKNKMPFFDDWPNRATSIREEISLWWNEDQLANVGVQLGPRSWIVDIECDSKTGEKNLVDLFDGDPPIVPMYQAKRGTHRLFRWQHGLPNIGVMKRGKSRFPSLPEDIEFRLGNDNKGIQSVFPPSVHPDGGSYIWKVHPSEARLIDLPEKIVKLLRSAFRDTGDSHSGISHNEWMQLLKEGAAVGERNDMAARLAGKILRSQDVNDNMAIAIQWELFKVWNVTSNPSPLSEKELRTTWCSILGKEREQRLGQLSDDVFAKYYDQAVADEKAAAELDSGAKPTAPADPDQNGQANGSVPGWKLVIVRSSPKEFKLYSPLWGKKARGGFIRLNTKEMGRPALIRDAAMEQAEVDVNDDFDVLWKGPKRDRSKGLKSMLMATHQIEDAPTEQHREKMIADLLLDAITKNPRIIEEGQDPDSRGRPCKLHDGSYAFKFKAVWEEMAKGDDKVKRAELSKILQEVGAAELRVGARDSQSRLKVLNDKSMKELRKLAEME